MADLKRMDEEFPSNQEQLLQLLRDDYDTFTEEIKTLYPNHAGRMERFIKVLTPPSGQLLYRNNKGKVSYLENRFKIWGDAADYGISFMHDNEVPFMLFLREYNAYNQYEPLAHMGLWRYYYLTNYYYFKIIFYRCRNIGENIVGVNANSITLGTIFKLLDEGIYNFAVNYHGSY